MYRCMHAGALCFQITLGPTCEKDQAPPMLIMGKPRNLFRDSSKEKKPTAQFPASGCLPAPQDCTVGLEKSSLELGDNLNVDSQPEFT